MSTEPLSAAQFKATRRLLSRKGRDQAGQFLAEGPQAVAEALRTPEAVRLVITDDAERHAPLLAGREVLVRRADSAQIQELSGTVTPQGILAVCTRPTVDLANLKTPRLVVICAQIRDPGNAGTVIRCADAFGADAVITTAGSVDPWHPRAVRASVGGVFHLPVVADLPLVEAISWARRHQLQVWAADAAGTSLDELDQTLGNATAWVFGNEAWGLTQDARAEVDRVVSVPMWGHAESLNLAAAAAVCLFASARAMNA